MCDVDVDVGRSLGLKRDRANGDTEIQRTKRDMGTEVPDG